MTNIQNNQNKQAFEEPSKKVIESAQKNERLGEKNEKFLGIKHKNNNEHEIDQMEIKCNSALNVDQKATKNNLVISIILLI